MTIFKIKDYKETAENVVEFHLEPLGATVLLVAVSDAGVEQTILSINSRGIVRYFNYSDIGIAKDSFGRVFLDE